MAWYVCVCMLWRWKQYIKILQKSKIRKDPLQAQLRVSAFLG